MSNVGTCRGCGMRTHILTSDDQTCLYCQEMGTLYLAKPARMELRGTVGVYLKMLVIFPFALYEFFILGVCGDLQRKKRNRIYQNRRGNMATKPERVRETSETKTGQDSIERVDTEGEC